MSDQNVGEGNFPDSAPVSIEQANGVITIVLTADNHLGYAAPGQGPRKREERKQRLRHAFQQATDFAIGQGVDLFIQAGDLFDTTNPDEQDRSFVAARLAQLRQAGVRTFALGGVHDTPTESGGSGGRVAPSPQISYARLGALHYFPPQPVRSTEEDTSAYKPAILDIRGTLVGIAGVGVLPGYEGDPLAHLHIESEIERAAIRMLILHAPIEGLVTYSSSLDTHAQVRQSSIEQLSIFRYILAGYHHAYRRLQVGQTDVVVAGATQYVDFNDSTDDPGFVFLGVASDGLRWCRHIGIDTLQLHRLIIQTTELWPDGPESDGIASTETVLERLRPLCATDALVHLRFEGEVTRGQYHQLDLNQVRRFGEEHSFALFIDDSALSFVTEQQAISLETSERFSPREELVAVADEWIAVAQDEQERKALMITKEELLAALDGVRYPASRGGSLH
jgi:DNA repair exonuclease SbcCD nuclease subunit